MRAEHWHRPPEGLAGVLARVLAGAVLAAVLASPAAAKWRALGDGLPASGQWRQGFDLADLDGDGRLDLVHGPARRGDGRPVVFLGDGRGGFSRWQEAKFPDLPFDYGAAVAADFDGDGQTDVALGCHLRGLSVSRGDGRGSFERWDDGLELDTTGEAFSSRALAVTDWDGDGRVDLLALGEGPSPGPSSGSEAGMTAGSYGLRVHLNRGDGSWSPVESPDPGRLFGYSLALGDTDGDGRVEAVTSSRSQGLFGVVHSAVADGGIQPAVLTDARPRSVLHAVETHDFDRDGRDEVAASFMVKNTAGEWVTGIDLFYSDEPSGGRVQILGLDQAVEISAIAAGDLDADGRPDLVAGGAGGRVWVFRGEPDGGFKRVKSDPIERAASGCKVSHVRLAELDGEPGDELVISFSGEPMPPKTCPSGGSIQVWQLR